MEICAPLLAKQGVVLDVCDFESSLGAAGEGDVIYCDPAYRAVTHDQFDRYGVRVYDWDDQVRLARAAARARERGALVVVSNTYCAEVMVLYADATRIQGGFVVWRTYGSMVGDPLGPEERNAGPFPHSPCSSQRRPKGVAARAF